MVLIYSYMCVSILALCMLCLCVDVWFPIRVLAIEPHVPGLSKLDALLHETHQGPSGTKVPRLDMCRSIISLSKITDQLWHDHPFRLRNKKRQKKARQQKAESKATEKDSKSSRVGGWRVGEGEGGLRKFEKKRGGRQ